MSECYCDECREIRELREEIDRLEGDLDFERRVSKEYRVQIGNMTDCLESIIENCHCLSTGYVEFDDGVREPCGNCSYARLLLDY